MIELRGVTKVYPTGTRALDAVDLHVPRGEFLFLTGPSGSGKTTLLRMLIRQETPTSGSIRVNGSDVVTMRPSQVPRLRRSIGVVFQDFRLVRRKTALENVAYVLNVAGFAPKEQNRRAYAALRGVHMHHRIGVLPAALSGGEQQRVAIARAVVNAPELLIADEPTGNLDPDLSVEIMKLFREVHARGTTVLIATHDRDLVRRMQRRTVTLAHGKLREGGLDP